jgi:hypothetical protein
MASTYVNDLRLNEMATGDASGSWGTVTNTNLELIGEAFSYGTETIGDADSTLTIADGAADAARSFYLKITSSVDLTTTRIVTLAPNTVSKVWMIENATTGSQVITIKQGSGATINVPNGQVKMLATDGAGSGGAVLDLLVDVDLTGTTTLVNLDVSGTLGVTGVLTATSLDISGDIDVDGTTNLDVVDIDGATQIDATVTVGVDDTGYDVKFFGATTGKSLLWDESADSLIVTGTTTLVGTTNLDAVDIDGATQIDATVTVGVDDTGYDVKFFGATAGAYMLWDESADDLILGGAAGLSVNSTALVTGVLTTTAATVSNGGGQFNGAINVGVDDTGYDVKFFGATTGKSLLWDESADSLTVAGNLSVDGGTIKLDGNYPVGTGNVALGDAALDSVEAGGSYNVAIGDSAGTAITTGDHNVAIGFNALDAEDGGTASVAIGSYALSSQNADGNNFNTAVGYVAGSDITTGIQNTLIGALAGDALIAAADNVAVGFEALSTETGGQNNVAIGPRALKVQVNASGNIYNTAVGSNAATATTTGNLNTAIGGNALYSNTTASNNTAVGYQAGYANTTGIQNLFVGSDAGYANTTGSGNTYVGRGDSVAAGVLMTTGSKNTILGGYNGNRRLGHPHLKQQHRAIGWGW